jgi:carboxyl-terminal processing protease
MGLTLRAPIKDISFMKFSRNGRDSSTAAWGAVLIAVLALSFLSISIPEAAAQSARNPDEDARRYGQLLQNIFQFITQNYVETVDSSKLYQGAMKGMLESLGDPHSVFLDESMLSDLMRDSDGIYGGVGLYISKPVPSAKAAKDGEPVHVEVVSPIEDTPAWREGIQPGDLILEIDGRSTSDMTVDEASAQIRGAAGTKVTLRFRRGSSFEFDVSFTRVVIEIPSVKSAVIDNAGVRTGYVRIIEWIPQTGEHVDKALKDMETEGIDRYIIDVRSNPGGLLSSVVDVTDLFLDSGMIVSTRGRNPQENAEYKADKAMSLPASDRIVVMLNKGSASASEIFAGAMKDRQRALLVGETSYGKGSVQQIFPIDTTGFKLTMARYYTPSGVNIDKTGIAPDVAVKGFDVDDEELSQLERLYDAGLVREYAKNHPDAGPDLWKAEAQRIVGMGYAIPLAYVEKLLRDELERTKPARLFDLEYDSQLNSALELLHGPDFDSMLKNSKSLLQTAAAAVPASDLPAAR